MVRSLIKIKTTLNVSNMIMHNASYILKCVNFTKVIHVFITIRIWYSKRNAIKLSTPKPHEIKKGLQNFKKEKSSE